MGLVSYAEHELKCAGLFDEDSDYDGMLGPAILNVVKAFADEGHSGCSASISIFALSRLLRFKPLALIKQPTPSDYIDIDLNGCILQHNRDAELFSNNRGKTWYALDESYRKVWWKPWTWVRNGRRKVRFPYMPK